MYNNHSHWVTPSPEMSQIQSFITCLLSLYFYIFCYFPSFPSICLKVEAFYLSESVQIIHKTVCCHHPQDLGIYADEFVLETTNAPLEIMVNHDPPLQLGPKTNTYQILLSQAKTRSFTMGIQVIVPDNLIHLHSENCVKKTINCSVDLNPCSAKFSH